jgi:hypothetical protein
MGYLELFPSPWNPNRAVLAVMGSTKEGVQWAANALLVSTIRSTLTGNFATVEDQFAFAFNTVETTVTQVAEASTEEAPLNIGDFRSPDDTATQEPISNALPDTVPTQPYERPAWVLPVVGVITVIIVILLVSVAIYSGLQGLRSKQPINRR